MMGPIAFDLLGTEGALQGLGAVLGLMAFPMTVGPPMAGSTRERERERERREGVEIERAVHSSF